MKQLLTFLIGTMIFCLACKKSSDQFKPTTGPLPTPTPAATFRGMTATVNGVTITADPAKILVRRRPADPTLGTLPYVLIMGESNNKQRLEVEIDYTTTLPQLGTYPLYYQRSDGHYHGRVYFDANTDLLPSDGIYFGSTSPDSAQQRGKIVVTVIDDHHFVGAFSAIVKSAYTGEEKEVINGKFGADY